MPGMTTDTRSHCAGATIVFARHMRRAGRFKVELVISNQRNFIARLGGTDLLEQRHIGRALRGHRTVRVDLHLLQQDGPVEGFDGAGLLRTLVIDEKTDGVRRTHRHGVENIHIHRRVEIHVQRLEGKRPIDVVRTLRQRRQLAGVLGDLVGDHRRGPRADRARAEFGGANVIVQFGQATTIGIDDV